jgi:hypothetical protein
MYFLKRLIRFYLFYNRFNFFFNSRFIIFKNLKKNFFFKKRKIFLYNDYIFYLYKRISYFNIKNRNLKKIYIIIHTIIYELSADCVSNNAGIDIENNIKDLNLLDLKIILKKTLPLNVQIRIKDKLKYNNVINNNNNNDINYFYKISLYESDYNYHLLENRYAGRYNIIFNIQKSKIINISYIKSKTKNFHFDYPPFIKEYDVFNRIKYLFYQKCNILSLKEFSKYKKILISVIKKELFFFCSYKKIFFQNGEIKIKNKLNIFFNKTNKITLAKIKNPILSFHGILSVNNCIIKESISHSLRDLYFIKRQDKEIGIPKITKFIDHKALVLPTASKSFSHYFIESLIRISYLKNNIQDYKIIVSEQMPKFIINIICYFGVKKKNILVKPCFESWRLKEILFPVLTQDQICKREIKFIENLCDKKKRNIISKKYKKIYISRRDSLGSRIFINEIEIEDFLKSIGFKIIFASELNIQQKINIIENADIIITPLGAAIYNLYFCKNIKAKIIFIGTKGYFRRFYIEFSFFKRINLFFLEASEIPSYSEYWNFEHSSFFLNKNILISFLKKNI